MSCPLPAEEHVLHDVEVVGEGEILVDRFDSKRGRVPRRPDVNKMALPSDLSPIWGMDPGDRTDLPAPLSPTSAVTCPAGTSRSTLTSACTAPKFLSMPRNWSKGSPATARRSAGACDSVGTGATVVAIVATHETASEAAETATTTSSMSPPFLWRVLQLACTKTWRVR
jgi:hypothetical protein